MLNCLNINSFASKRRSLRRPVLDSNLAIIRAESQTLRLEHFKFKREWQARTKEMLFYDRYRGEIVEYGFPVFNECILPITLRSTMTMSPTSRLVRRKLLMQLAIPVAYPFLLMKSIRPLKKRRHTQDSIEIQIFAFETMPVPSLPETLPRDLVPRKSRSLRPSGLASSLRLYRPQQFHHTRSNIGHTVANPKRLGIPTTFKQIFDESPPSASSLLKRYAGKQTRTQTPSSPSIAGPSRFSGNFEGSSQAGSSSSRTIEEDNDVLVYCLSCHRYCALEHFCIKDISPEL
ncbi:hypothetical protein M422DRAFT_245582 [Sphaerobolus stellatus SS14]|nr:hypothetical protein M422DRAFT_245582 [Sphaerobolus stellatus SS14]